MKILIVYIIIICSLFSCKKITTQLNISENKLEEIGKSIMSDNTIDLLIREDSFLGIMLNDSINKHEFILTKNKISFNDIESDSYNLSTLQYINLAQIITKKDNKNIINSIIITSPQAKTELGLKIGSTLKDIKERISTFQIKKLKTGRIYIEDSSFKYFLNDDIHLISNAIPDSLTIQEIVIFKKQKKQINN